jgi:SAM-dependent methyltransferase
VGLKKITVDVITELNNRMGPNSIVLDVGCGDRIYEQFITCKKYIGIDIEQSGRSSDKKLPDMYFDGLDIPFNNNFFDFIICTEVLEHAIDPEYLCAEMRRVLKPNGLLLITVPSMWGEHEVPFDFRRYTSFGIELLAKNSSLEIVKYQKEKPGIDAYIQLGCSEINASSAGNLYKKTAKFWLRITAIFLKFIKINMPRIYLTNVVILKKNNKQESVH